MIKLLGQTKIQLFIVLLLTTLAYLNIFQNQLVIDDIFFIAEWPQMQSFDIGALLTGSLPDKASGVYRPVRSILYAIYYQLGGESPFIYHLHSLLVHLTATVLVYFIIRHFTSKVKKMPASQRGERLHLRGGGLSFLTALLFGLHPIHTEEITYISASMDATGIMFLLASFYFYIRVVQGASFIFAFLAFFTNEFALILPFLLILYDHYFKNDQFSIRNFQFKKLPYIPYFVLAGAYLFLRLFMVNVPFSRGDYLAQSFYHTMLTMPKIFMQYIYLLFLPLKLSFYHTLAPGFENYMVSYTHFDSILKQKIYDPDIFLPILGLIGLIGLIVLLFKKHKLISFCLAWFFITILPVSYIIPVGPAISERYLYLSSFGFCLGLAWVLNGRIRLIGLTCLIGLITLYFYKTYQRNQDWKDTPSLYQSTLKIYPQSLIASYHLAVYYSTMGQFDKSVPAYQKVVEIEPNFYEAHANLANSYFNIGKPDLAAVEYQKSLLINPNFLDSYLNLAEIYLGQGKKEQAVFYLKKGLAIDISQYRVLGNLKSIEEINYKFAQIRQTLKQLNTH